MDNYLQDIRKFVQKQEERNDIKFVIYNKKKDLVKFFKNKKINVKLDHNKEIILQEESKLELGGMNRKSFSIIHPTSESDEIFDGNIILIGPEIKDLKENNVDFGMFILIKVKKISENQKDQLKQYNFISNGIEGLLIRSVPRKFWCRISKYIIKKGFSFEFLGNAIMYLYKQKFADIINSIEIIFINSYPDVIKEFIQICSAIYKEDKEKWKKKIEEWKKRVDCNYDWGCEICPYQEECQDVKEVLIEREELDEKN